MQEEAHREDAVPIGIDRPLHYRNKEKRMFQRKVEDGDVCTPLRVLNDWRLYKTRERRKQGASSSL